MRKSKVFFIYIIVQTILLGCMFANASYKRKIDRDRFQNNLKLVRRLSLTDLCLFTEASYTRHLSLADFHAAFQDSPMAQEHFPSGSLLGHPQADRNIHANVD